MARVVLTSTSPYRRQLLARLGVAFEVASPPVDETPLAGEPPDARALRLAEEKAVSLVSTYPDALLLGGDQTIACGEMLFDKPGSKENAIAQLLKMRGKALTFYTAVALADARSGAVHARLVTHRAKFRNAEEAEIHRYVEKEDALNCAGGAQIEGLGISLLEELEGGDPTALVGMPLMHVAALLRTAGVQVP